MSVKFNNDTVEKHREMAEVIKSNLQVQGNHITEKEAHLAYNKTLPEGFTPESVKVLAKHNNNFTKAAYVAVGEVSGDVFVNQKDVEKVTAQIGFFAPTDSLQFTAERSREYPNPQATGDDPAKITKNLVLTMSSDIRGQSVKTIRDAMSDEFKNRFC